MRTPNYDKYPAIPVDGLVFTGWEHIREKLHSSVSGPLFVDHYTGVFEEDMVSELGNGFARVIRLREYMKPEAEVRDMTEQFMTNDVLFGHVTCLRLEDFFDSKKLCSLKEELKSAGKDTLVIGTGAALVMPKGATLVYADMARWEIQQRFRRHEVRGLGVDNHEDPVSIQYKRGYFIDWRVLDQYKDT